MASDLLSFSISAYPPSPSRTKAFLRSSIMIAVRSHSLTGLFTDDAFSFLFTPYFHCIPILSYSFYLLLPPFNPPRLAYIRPIGLVCVTLHPLSPTPFNHSGSQRLCIMLPSVLRAFDQSQLRRSCHQLFNPVLLHPFPPSAR